MSEKTSEESCAMSELERARHLQTLEGMADVDAGKLIAHCDVVAWAEGLSAAQEQSQ